MFFFFFLVHVGRKLPLKRNTRPGDRIIHQSERNLPLSLNVTRSSKLSPKKSQLQLHEVKQLQETSNPFSCIFSESEWAWDSCPRRQLSVFWHSLDVDFLKKKKKKKPSLIGNIHLRSMAWSDGNYPPRFHVTSELLNLTSAEASHLSQSMKPAGILPRFDASHQLPLHPLTVWAGTWAVAGLRLKLRVLTRSWLAGQLRDRPRSLWTTRHDMA